MGAAPSLRSPATSQVGHGQAGHPHLICRAETDRGRRPRCRVCRSRARRWSRRHPAARLAVRHLRLRRCRPGAGAGRLPGDRALAARLRHDALPLRRNAAQRPAGALATDVIALMDALKIDKAVIAGFDWGARTADIVAAIWPQRVKALVSVSGYLIGSQQANANPLPPSAELQWWYQYYFATERGRLGYEKYRREFSKLIWQLASPKWNFDDATFERSACPRCTSLHMSRGARSSAQPIDSWPVACGARRRLERHHDRAERGDAARLPVGAEVGGTRAGLVGVPQLRCPGRPSTAVAR